MVGIESIDPLEGIVQVGIDRQLEVDTVLEVAGHTILVVDLVEDIVRILVVGTVSIEEGSHLLRGELEPHDEQELHDELEPHDG